MGVENRNYPRQEIALTVCIEATDGTKVSCWLADLSQTGARLALRQAGTVPDEFMLGLSDQMKRWCRVVWRSGEEIGVHFERRSQAGDRPPEERRKQSVMIKCPRTQRCISTGMRVHDTDELGKMPDVRRFAQCPHCKVVHGWSVSEATI
jgi:PilZ domain